MSAWAHGQAKICHILWASDDQKGIPSLFESLPDVGVWGVCIIVGRGIYGFPPPDAAWMLRTGEETATSIYSPYAKGILGGLPVDGHVCQLSG